LVSVKDRRSAARGMHYHVLICTSFTPYNTEYALCLIGLSPTSIKTTGTISLHHVFNRYLRKTIIPLGFEA
jgi:hypothetical protein